MSRHLLWDDDADTWESLFDLEIEIKEAIDNATVAASLLYDSGQVMILTDPQGRGYARLYVTTDGGFYAGAEMRICYVTRVEVLDQFRGQGVGTALCDAAHAVGLMLAPLVVFHSEAEWSARYSARRDTYSARFELLLRG